VEPDPPDDAVKDRGAVVISLAHAREARLETGALVDKMNQWAYWHIDEVNKFIKILVEQSGLLDYDTAIRSAYLMLHEKAEQRRRYDQEEMDKAARFVEFIEAHEDWSRGDLDEALAKAFRMSKSKASRLRRRHKKHGLKRLGHW